MPYTIKPANILDATADVLVIPHTSNGHLFKVLVAIPDSTQNQNPADRDRKVNKLLEYLPKTASLGDLTLIAWPHPEILQFKYVAFACTEDSGNSTYTAFRKVAIRLMKQLANLFYGSAIKIAVPALGTASEQLSVIDSCRIFYSACKEQGLHEPVVDFFSMDKQVIATLTQKYVVLTTNATSLIEAFKCSILASKKNKWVAELATDDEFYFSLATDKFQEFRNFEPTRKDFFETLVTALIESKLSFQSFLTQTSENTEEYKFLMLCGELVAYIDKTAYNKNQWNKYPDRRTIANANIKPADWIRNLIGYKYPNFSPDPLPQAINNAIQYLLSPHDHLTVLSMRHRNLLARNALGANIWTEALYKPLFELFISLDIRVKNKANTGALYSRILYLPEIKELWLEGSMPEPEEEESEPMTPGPKEPGQPTMAEPGQLDTPPPRYLNGRSIEATIHSDLFSETDLLNHGSYARAISRFITHRNTTPPLTVGILAPWGKGKTSLMKLIQKNLKEITHQLTAATPERTAEKDVQTTYGQFIDYLKEPLKNLMSVQKLQFPTIWFNAWNFQKNEQVWAGFAHEIINQLIGQLPTQVQQEKAWLALNLRRLDRQKLRSKVHQTMFNRFIPAVLVAFLCVFAFFFKNSPLTASIIFATPLASAGVLAWLIYKKIRSSKLGFDLYKYVRQPNYEDKLGYLHTIKEDLRLALQLLVEEDKPAVIFIDDLDRCSPSTTTELVEAINSFISGDLPYCYFILGQDAQMVAASLDVTYKEVGDKLSNLQKGYGSLGWFFMEKFMQLQFNIPIMQAPDSQRIMSSLLNRKEKKQTDASRSDQEISQQADELLSKIGYVDNEIVLHEQVNAIEDSLLQLQPEKLAEIKTKLVDTAAENYDDQDREVALLIEEFAIHLTASPRMVKRFVNLYRFYRFIQFTGQNKEMLYTDARSIAKWIIIMIKWPQLVRTIQWDAEKDFQNGSSPVERATNFESAILISLGYESWLASVSDKYKNGSAWLTDKGLYEFLKGNFTEDSSLKAAVGCRFW